MADVFKWILIILICSAVALVITTFIEGRNDDDENGWGNGW